MNMQVIEGNKLLCNYMGLKPKLVSPDKYAFSHMPYYYVDGDNPETVMDGIAHYVKYHSSWDWLREVINKILNECNGKIIKDVDAWLWFSQILNIHINDSIETVWYIVVQFVKTQVEK